MTELTGNDEERIDAALAEAQRAERADMTAEIDRQTVADQRIVDALSARTDD